MSSQEYYLRVSVKESDVIIHQYNIFTSYNSDKCFKLSEILQDMLDNVIGEYKLDANRVLVEQFNRF